MPYGKHSHLCGSCRNEVKAALDAAEAHIDADADQGYTNDHPKACDRCGRVA